MAVIESFFLYQGLVFEGDLTIVADFPECGSKAPFVSSYTQGLGVFDTLRSNPADSLYALLPGQHGDRDARVTELGEWASLTVAALTGQDNIIGAHIFMNQVFIFQVTQGTCQGLATLYF